MGSFFEDSPFVPTLLRGNEKELKSISKMLQWLHSSLKKTVNCKPTTVNGYKIIKEIKTC